jgi:hypothetical protein
MNNGSKHGASRGAELVSELLQDPVSFRRQGKSTVLLDHFFHGFSLSHLHELISSKDPLVAKTAVSMMAELPESDVDQFIEDAIAVSRDQDNWIRHCALGVIMRVTTSQRHEDFAFILEHLEDIDDLLVEDALAYFIKASLLQLTGALRRFSSSALRSGATHVTCLQRESSSKSFSVEEMKAMINQNYRLRALYGIGIAMRRNLVATEGLDILERIEDSDLKSLYVRVRNRHYGHRKKHRTGQS